MARSTVDHRLDALHIGLPSTIGTSVGVGNLNAEGNALTTKITLSHSLHLLLHDDLKISPFRRRFDMIPKFAEKCKCFFRKFNNFLRLFQNDGLFLVFGAFIPTFWPPLGQGKALHCAENPLFQVGICLGKVVYQLLDLFSLGVLIHRTAVVHHR